MSIFDTQPSLNEALRVLDCRIREIDSKVGVLQGLEISRQEEVVQALGTKCVVKDCTNHTHQGSFVGLLCAPCHSAVSGGDGGGYSQVARNTKREWVGLTDEEILADDGVLGYHFGKNGSAGPVTATGKAIIEVVTAMLKERNT